MCDLSQPTRAAWIEISYRLIRYQYFQSQPTRAAWIEITSQYILLLSVTVAAHSGCVD